MMKAKKKWYKWIMSMCLTLLVCFFTFKTFASGPNWYSNKEIAQLLYQGYIQFKPCYYDSELGGRVYRAYIRYTNFAGIDTGHIYTEVGKSREDCNIYDAMVYCWDTWDWNAPKTKFFYNFSVIRGSYWPILSVDEPTSMYNVTEDGTPLIEEVGGFETLE